MKIFILTLVLVFAAQSQADRSDTPQVGASVVSTGFDSCCQAHQNDFSLTEQPFGKGSATPGVQQKGGSGPSSPAVETGI